MIEDIDLAKPGVKGLLGKQVLADIDRAAIKLYSEGLRTHLGASIIGDKCMRKLWYGFRWVDYKVHEGRQYRLFNRGHKEESRFTEWLTLAGYKVEAVNPLTGEQWRVSGIGGHFGGSMDGKILLPAEYGYSQKLILEYKTNGTGKGFNDLIDKGMKIAKPQHFDQMSVYGNKEQLQYGLYLNVCKNDDNIYSEIVKLDWQRGAELEDKAQIIILSQEPLNKLSDNPAYFECKFCDFKEVCHENKPAIRNCRSCSFATPRDNKEWFCNRHSGTIPSDFIKTGCGDWKSII